LKLAHARSAGQIPDRPDRPRRDHIDRLGAFSFYTKMKHQDIVERALDEFFKRHGM
jgi:hypothetical protein